MNITKSIKNKPDLNYQSKSFIIISSNYQLETLYNILVKNPSLINTKDHKNETLLSYAIRRKNIEISELILTSPILDISYQDINGNSYLHLAVIKQLENIIRLLIKKGININLQNNEGNTALHYAYNTGDIKYIAILVENKADLNIKNKNGLTPEEIEKNSILYLDYLNNHNNESNLNLDISIKTNNSNTINMNNKKYIENTILATDKSKINKTIKIDWENSDINTRSNKSKNYTKYSLVNFSYSEDEENKNNNEYDNDNDNDNEAKDKIDKVKNENIKNEDIFNLTSTLTYKEKLANVESINSHIVGNINNFIKDENNEDSVNIKKIKTNENRSINNSLINKIKNKNIYHSKSNRTDYEKNKKKEIYEDSYFHEFKSFNDEYSNNKKEYNSKIYKKSKDLKDLNNIDKNNDNQINIIKKNNNNEENTIFYQPEFDENFTFSPFGTINEPIHKKHIIKNINNNYKNNINLENQQLLYNSLKNIQINSNNKSTNNNNPINLNLNFNNDTTNQQNPSFLNSKSIRDLYSSDMTAEDTLNKSKNLNLSQNSLYKFLSEIKLEKYYNLMNSNGFEDIQILINQGKSILAINDSQLKETGIDKPGDRAKILIRLQEKAGNFCYQIPKNVYYTCNNLENYMNDINVNKLNDWLKALKIENYLENFIEAGYYSVELMLIQMESKNPITDNILKDEIGINKIGHRARIINKLLEEGKKLNNKLKTSMLIVGNGQTEKICDCILF